MTIVERSGTSSPPGYELAGWQADITAPAATVANPLRLTFWLDSSALGALDAMTVQIFRNGSPVPPCDEPATGVAAPDPCVVDRQVVGDGDAALDILTSAASTWTFGRMLDTTPPTISIASPVDGAQFTLGQVVTADYACADGGSGLASCAGPVAPGGTIDTATAGTKSFTVTASDAAGNPSTAVSTYEVLAGSVTATATGPAVVSTDPGGLGASPAIPVQTRLDVASGTAGEFSLAAQAAGSPPAGYVALSTAVVTSGPPATAASPHTLTFTLDASMVGELAPAQVDVIANGVLVATCGAGSGAVPNPCVASRTDGADGDVVITVRTAALTTWTFARRSFVVTSATPSSRAQGTSAQTVVLAGDGFQAGATAKISGTAVTVAATTWLSPSSLRLTLTVGASAAVGSRDVTVTNPNKATAVCAGCFAVAAKPTVSSLSPPSRPTGTSHATIQLTGTGLQDGAAVSFAGTGVLVHSVTYVDATRLDLDVSIDAAAATGGRAVTVVNPDGGSGTKSAALTVNATPTITTVAPTNLRQGRIAERRGQRHRVPDELRRRRRHRLLRRRRHRHRGRPQLVEQADGERGSGRGGCPGSPDCHRGQPRHRHRDVRVVRHGRRRPADHERRAGIASPRHDGPGHHDQWIGLPTRCRGEAVGYGDHRDGDDGPGPVDRDRDSCPSAPRRRSGRVTSPSPTRTRER